MSGAASDGTPSQSQIIWEIRSHLVWNLTAGATEAMTMAGLEHFKVISVDYRMPPEAYFPAAIDDVLTVYKALQRPDPARSA